MTTQTVSTQNIWAGLSGRAGAVGLRRSIISCLLLVSVFLSGMVPQGYMRAADGGGMAIVICTTNGASEVWLSANGDISDKAPAHETPSELPGCLAITVVLTAIQTAIDTHGQTIEFAPYRMALVDRRESIAPALTPLQPRAPPVAI